MKDTFQYYLYIRCSYSTAIYKAHSVSYWVMEPPRTINFVLDYSNYLLNFVITMP